MRFDVSIDVMPKREISDPEGQTIERALPSLGFNEITGVRVGKRITFSMEASDEDSARKIAEEACVKFLTNPIIEEYSLEVTSA